MTTSDNSTEAEEAWTQDDLIIGMGVELIRESLRMINPALRFYIDFSAERYERLQMWNCRIAIGQNNRYNYYRCLCNSIYIAFVPVHTIGGRRFRLSDPNVTDKIRDYLIDLVRDKLGRDAITITCSIS